jgi:parvulin-like peptidyl-prolyl isomerase
MTENVIVQHILFTVDASMTADQKKEVLNRAESVYKEIVSGKKTFEEAVSLYSEHVASKMKGGTWTTLFRDDTKARDTLGASFFNQCFELEVNKVSPVMTSQYGYHIVRISAKTPSGLVGLDAEITKGSGKTIRKQISDLLYNKTLESNFLLIYQEYVKNLRADLNSSIIIDELALSMVGL